MTGKELWAKWGKLVMVCALVSAAVYMTLARFESNEKVRAVIRGS